MKLLATADWQTCLDNLPRCEQSLQHLLEVIQTHHVDVVLLLGDLKEAFNPVDQRVTNFLLEATYRIRQACERGLDVPVFGGPVFVLAGNHDHIGMSDASPTCLPVMAAAGAIVVETAQSFELSEGLILDLVPFHRDPAKFQQQLRNRKPSKAKGRLLGFHQEIFGCQASVAYQTPNGIKLSALKHYDLCLSGHIHNPQQLGNVVYVGSPFCQDWSEVNQRKRFLLVDVEGNSIKTKSIWTKIPGWYDPEITGYLPKVWTGTHVRVTARTAQEEALLQKKYPGAILHLRPPESPSSSSQEIFSITDTDRNLIQQYLTANPSQSRPEALTTYLLSKLTSDAAATGKLAFRKVEAQNVLCFQSASIELDHSGITLVTGRDLDWGGRSNGAGKSSLLSLPLVAIFGATPKGQTHDALACNKANGKAEVVLTLEDASKLVHTITRTRKPVSLSYQAGTQDKTMGTIPATQQLIETRLGLSWDVVCNALYIGQQEIATVLSGTDKQRKELFSRFLRLDRFLTATEAVRKDLHKVEDKLAQVTQWHSELEEVIAALQESLKHFGRVPDIQEVQQEVLTANTYLAKVQTELALAQQKAQKNGQSTQAARRLEVYWAGKVSIIKERLWAAQQKLQTLPVSASQCPTCLQPVTQAWVTKASEEQHLRVGKLSRILANRQASLSKAERQFASTEKKEVRCYKRAMELSQRIPEVTAKIATLQALVNKAAERQQLQQQIEGKKQVQRRHKDAIAAYEGDQEMLQEALKVVSRNGLPSYLCTTACPMLNKASQEYSQLLTEGKIEVQFLVNEGEVDIQVVNHNGGDTITDQSQGEGRLAGLIAAFSLRRVFANYNLLILDEPGEGLDSHNAEVFARSLNQIAKQFGSLYITTHNPFILGNLKPSRHLEVVKSKGTSKVEELL